MPQVLHIISGLKVGGAEMALLRLITSFRNSDFEHTVIALTSDGAMKQRFQEANIKLELLDFKRSPVSQCWRLMLLIKKINPDIVQTWMYHADFFGGIAARFLGIRNIVWGIHNTDVTVEGVRTTALSRLCAWLSSYVPKVIICVAEAARCAHIGIGYKQGNMVVIPNGFDLQSLKATAAERQALRNRCGFGAAAIVIGSLGRFNAAKDHNNFIQAAGLLAQRFPHLRFLMVGRDLEASNVELLTWIQQTGYADRFVLLSERSDVPVCLSAMDIFCLHSRTEAFPLVLGEAMAVGLPCVTTDVGDAALMLGDGDNVVPAKDPAALAQGLGKMLALTPEERASLGQKSKQRIHDEFTLTHTRDRFEVIYNKILKI